MARGRARGRGRRCLCLIDRPRNWARKQPSSAWQAHHVRCKARDATRREKQREKQCGEAGRRSRPDDLARTSPRARTRQPREAEESRLGPRRPHHVRQGARGAISFRDSAGGDHEHVTACFPVLGPASRGLRAVSLRAANLLTRPLSRAPPVI